MCPYSVRFQFSDLQIAWIVWYGELYKQQSIDKRTDENLLEVGKEFPEYLLIMREVAYVQTPW
jgi:hypothetical protein